MYHAGAPAWHVNDVDGDVYDMTMSPQQKINFFLGGELCTPESLDYECAFYLGHGRMGSIPDYPWLVYNYHPKWSEGRIIRDNPTGFLSALKEMVTALWCIREGKHFAVENTKFIEPKYAGAIKEIFFSSSDSISSLGLLTLLI